MKDPAHARIYSTRADEAGLEEAIEAFVIGLAERIDTLQDAQFSGDSDTLEKLAADLAGAAGELGYPALSDAAHALMATCVQKNSDAALETLLTITEIGRRVRRGHRGAS